MREKTDYYKNIDTCPSYNPDERFDPYPGQPFFKDVENPKANSYHPNLYIYNPPTPYVHSDNRRDGDGSVKASTGTFRHWINNGDVSVGDESIEIRNIKGTVVMANIPIASDCNRECLSDVFDE